jgi:acyl-CoA:acyl-CoA alkyltransferase
VGLCLAQTEGKLKRGDAIALIPASAGLVAAVVQLTF